MPDKNAKDAAAVETPEEGGGEKKGGNTILVIGIIVGVVLIQGVLAYLLIPKPVDEEAIAAKRMEDSLRLAAEAVTKIGFVMEDMPISATVNIAGTNGERFLKVIIVLEYDEKYVKAKKLDAELRSRAVLFEDILTRHLSTLTLAEVDETGAKDKIEKDLLRIINGTIPAQVGEVRRILFREYKYQ